MLCKAVKMMRNSLGLNYKSAAPNQLSYAGAAPYESRFLRSCKHWRRQLGEEFLRIHRGVYLLGSFGASEATIFSKRGSPRSGSQTGNSFKAP
jgi:hypothetical protein